MSHWGRALLALSALLPIACARPAAPPSPTPPPSAPAPVATPRYQRPEGLERLRLSLTPHWDPAVLIKAYQPLAARLGERLEVPIEVTVARSYDGLGEDLRSGRADLGVFSPFAYVRAKRADRGLQPIVAFISDGSPSAAGYILVRQDSPFFRLEDLRGHRFAFVDRASTTGYLFPIKLLLDRGLWPDDLFRQTLFLGNHHAVMRAIIRGEVEAGATHQGALSAFRRTDGVDPLDFRVIAKTDRAPRDLLCARAGVPRDVVDELRRILLAVSVQSAQGRALLGPMGVNGFSLPDEARYEAVRAADDAVSAQLRPVGPQ